jgi:hypothetical protein
VCVVGRNVPNTFKDILARTRKGKNGCLEWTGHVNSSGYGQAKRDGKECLVHRWAWEYWRGPIPKGKKVLHKCDNTRCLRMRHLFLGSQKDNVRDMCRKGRHMNGKKTHCWRGHPLKGANLCINYKGERQCRNCGAIRARIHLGWILQRAETVPIKFSGRRSI